MDCKKCSDEGISFIKYSENYDSYCCGICGEWLEKVCDDPDCTFCPGRPEKAIIKE